MPRVKDFLSRYGNVVFFIGGFLFDSLTIIRIDSLLDIAIQFFYLGMITLMIALQVRVDAGRWIPSGRWARLWHYESEVIHFFYGGLLSAYVVLYFKSASFSRSIVFLTLVAFLMVANEMPQVRKAGNLLRLGLYALCVVSFLNYLVPILVGRMGWWVFVLAWLASGCVNYLVLKDVARHTDDPQKQIRRFGLAPASVLVIIFTLYFSKLIPPVPLSVQYLGIYHNVDRVGGRFQLTYRKPHWSRFWKKDDTPFVFQPGDRIFVFARIFAPSRFQHQAAVRFVQRDAKGVWRPTDRIPLNIVGGRDQGFRGTVTKSNFDAGAWRVEVETEDGRVLAVKQFDVEADSSTRPASFSMRTM